MINKLLLAFLLVFFVGALLSFIVEGRSGMASTRLTASVSESSSTIYVRSTEGWPKVGTLYIGDETIEYRGTTDTAFLSCSRGVDGTTAEAHDQGSLVYTSESYSINKALGFNVTTAASSGGIFAFPVIAWGFITHTLPKLVTFDFAFLQGEPLVWFRYFMMLFSIGLIFAVFYVVFTAVGSVGSTLFSRFRV